MKLAETAKKIILSLNYDKNYYIEAFNQFRELRFNLSPSANEYSIDVDSHTEAMQIIKLIRNDCDFISYNYHFKDTRTPYTSNKINFFVELVSIETLCNNVNIKDIANKESFKNVLKNPETELRFSLRSVPIDIVYNDSEIDSDKQNCIKVQDKHEAISLINKFLDKLDILSNDRHHLKDDRSSHSKEGYLFLQLVKVQNKTIVN
ncbi:hypothetical protein [Flavobacterium chungangensis]|uniref:Uncharacterized protein n=1 Tax=Flavobacterium chungangensis TaxID=2708132 RepID=A0ABV8ZKK9_9FLAO